MEGGTTATPRAAAVRSPGSQHLVEDLIQALMNGKVLCLLNAAGHSTECVASLDRKLSTLMLAFPGQAGKRSQSIPMQSISQIRVGDRCGDKVTSWTGRWTIFALRSWRVIR